MIDTRIPKLLKLFFKIKGDYSSYELSILYKKYEECFTEIKYLFEKSLSLSVENYLSEYEDIIREIDQKEKILLAIVTEMIEEVKND